MVFTSLGAYTTKTIRSLTTPTILTCATSLNYFFFLPNPQTRLSTSTRKLNMFFCFFNFISIFSFLSTSLLQVFFSLRTVTFSFTGKGHKLVSNINTTLAFSFGHSHIYYLYNPEVMLKFRTKTRGFFLGLTLFTVREALFQLFAAKPINIFTGRGVRARRQLIFKKIGKLSLYM